MTPFLLGLVAASLTTAAYVPQVLQSWRSKSTRDLSLPMLILFCSGVLLWLVYGLWVHDLPVTVANALTLVLALSLLLLKLTNYGGRPEDTPSLSERMEPNLPSLKAVVFDLDGTLADTLPLCIEAFRRAVEPATGRSLSDAEIISTFGPSEEGTIRTLAPNRYAESLADYLTHYERLHDQYPTPFDGVRTLLHYLRCRGVRVGLVTGKGPESTRISLRQFTLESMFEVVETGSPYGPRKPEALRHILSEWKLDPRETVYIGDAPSDVTAAQSVGMPVIAAGWAATTDVDALRDLQPDGVALSVDELFTWLEARLSRPTTGMLP